MNDERIHEEAFSVERVQFKKTDRRVSPRKTDPFLFLEGTLPVLVSAPHAVRTLRQGKRKRSDEFTGALAWLLNRYGGCHTLATRKLYGGDPNWDEECFYKARLAEIAATHDIAVVLDLHGAAREQPFDIDLGTMHGQSLLGQKIIRKVLTDSFHAEGLKQVSRDTFPAETQHTITRFCARELSIPAVQIEINRRYRKPNQNGADFRKLYRALAAATTLLGQQIRTMRQTV